MRHFIISISKPFSSTKVYYPALLSPNYDNIEYAASYVNWYHYKVPNSIEIIS